MGLGDSKTSSGPYPQRWILEIGKDREGLLTYQYGKEINGGKNPEYIPGQNQDSK